MGRIDIDVNNILSYDHILVEIANEIRDNEISSNRLEYEDHSYRMNIIGELITARNYLHSANQRLSRLRTLTIRAANKYATAEEIVYRKLYGNSDLEKVIGFTMGRVRRSDFFTTTSQESDERMKNLFNRQEEEDYYFCVELEYGNTVLTADLYKNYTREYVDGVYNKETQQMEKYTIAKQYIGEGVRETYKFSEDEIFVYEELLDVTNYYDGKEFEGDVTSGAITGSGYKVKNEHMDKMCTRDYITKTEAAKDIGKYGLEQELTDTDIEGYENVNGGVIGSRKSIADGQMIYRKGENLIEDPNSWTHYRIMDGSIAPETKMFRGYYAGDLNFASRGDINASIAEIKTTYHIKTDDAIHSISRRGKGRKR